MLEVPVVRLDPELPLPRYARPGDAGVDLVAATDLELAPGGRGLVPTGVAVAIPRGYAGFIQPRSGLALRHGVTVLIAGGMGLRPLMGFNQAGIEVFRGSDAPSVEAAVQALLHGELAQFTREFTCGGHQHGHTH